MEELAAAAISVERGVEDDFRGKPGRRQVTVMARHCWDTACAEIGVEPLVWTTRRANLLVDRIDLAHKVGWDLRIGDAVLAITGETRPCKRMDEACPGLKEALQPNWRGGVTCQVVRSGEVRVGSEVSLSRNFARQIVRVLRQRTRFLLKGGRRVLGGIARRVGLRRRRGQNRPR